MMTSYERSFTRSKICHYLTQHAHLTLWGLCMSDNCIIRLYPANFSNWPVAPDLSLGWMMSWAWAAHCGHSDNSYFGPVMGRDHVTSLWRQRVMHDHGRSFLRVHYQREPYWQQSDGYWCVATPDTIYAGEEMTCGGQTQETVTRISRVLLRHANSDRLGVWRGWFVLPTIVGGVVSVTPGNKYSDWEIVKFKRGKRQKNTKETELEVTKWYHEITVLRTYK